MDRQEKLSREDWLEVVTLRGRVVEGKPGEQLTLLAGSGLVTIDAKDVRAVRDLPNEEKEISVNRSAKLLFETRVSPAEVGGILSREGIAQLRPGWGFAGGECECSRCSGGECECSRCSDCDQRTWLGRYAGGECECSRCVEGPCECSRCASLSVGWRGVGGRFWRRVG